MWNSKAHQGFEYVYKWYVSAYHLFICNISRQIKCIAFRNTTAYMFAIKILIESLVTENGNGFQGG